MKGNLIVWVAWIIVGIPGYHGGHMATYAFEVNAHSIQLDFSIEQEVLEHFPMMEQCENYQLTKALCLSNYIRKHASLEIEGKRVEFEMIGSQQKDDYFQIHMQAEGNFPSASAFTIENTCFYEFDSHFENRIVFSKNGQTDSYRLSVAYPQLEIHP